MPLDKICLIRILEITLFDMSEENDLLAGLICESYEGSGSMGNHEH